MEKRPSILLIALFAALVSGCSVFNQHASQEFGCPRYTQDGTGVYAAEYVPSSDDSGSRVLYFSKVGARPREAHSSESVPVDVIADAQDFGVPGFHIRDKRVLATSPSGRFEATPGHDSSRNDPAEVVVVDRSRDTSHTFTLRPDGSADQVVWLDDVSVVVGISMRADDRAEVVLLDTSNGKLHSVFRVDGKDDDPASIDRIVGDPEGRVVFSALRSTLEDHSDLHVFDPLTRRVSMVGEVPQFGYWDYSPTRHMVVTWKESKFGESELAERQLALP